MCKGPVVGESLAALKPEDIGAAAVKGLGGAAAGRQTQRQGCPPSLWATSPLGMDINLKPLFLLQLKSDFSPWPIVLSTAEPSESQTHPPPDPC